MKYLKRLKAGEVLTIRIPKGTEPEVVERLNKMSNRSQEIIEIIARSLKKGEAKEDHGYITVKNEAANITEPDKRIAVDADGEGENVFENNAFLFVDMVDDDA